MPNTPLPPSMEKAYHGKCIELRRRLNEIEDANDAARLRKRRIERSILKMRLERAFFLDKLARSQQVNSIEDSDRSTSPPSMVRTFLCQGVPEMADDSDNGFRIDITVQDALIQYEARLCPINSHRSRLM